MAERFGLTYRKVRITGARSRWGSCTSAKTISLSCYLMLVPSHLIDYVILHELAHTREMNHGPRFWELLDSMTAGQALRFAGRTSEVPAFFLKRISIIGIIYTF